jgi:uncharacterized tellurite resistance protein B-like protein
VDHALSSRHQLEFRIVEDQAARMPDRDKASALAKRTAALPDEKIQQLAEMLFEAIDPAADFGEFEQKLLEISNQVCREAIKKNSRK